MYKKKNKKKQERNLNNKEEGIQRKYVGRYVNYNNYRIFLW